MKNVVGYTTQWLCHISQNNIDRPIRVLSSIFLRSNTPSSLSSGVVQTLLARRRPIHLSLSLYSHACPLPLYSKSESAAVNGKKSYAGRCFTTALPSSSTSRVSLPLPFSISQLLPTDRLSPLLFSVSHMLSGAPLFPSYSSPTSRTRSSSLDLADGCRVSFPQPPLSSHGEPAQISGFKSSS
jgi:hypothetical protein